MARNPKSKKTQEDYDREYAAWLLERVIKFGVDTPVPHNELVEADKFSITLHGNINRAINFGHVRFTHDKRTMITQHALWFLNRYK